MELNIYRLDKIPVPKFTGIYYVSAFDITVYRGSLALHLSSGTDDDNDVVECA